MLALPVRLEDRGAGVDRHGDARDVAGLVGGEEQHRVRDVDRLDQLLFISSNLHDPRYGSFNYPPGEYTAVFKIPEKLLNIGPHQISAYLISDLNYHDVHVDKAISFEVVEDGSDRGDYTGGWAGLVRPVLDWSIHP